MARELKSGYRRIKIKIKPGEDIALVEAVRARFPDITVDSVNSTLPDKNARILIYCNNNFVGAPEAFPTKMAVASLNLSTYIALYSYGFRNIYELGPLLDVKSSKLEFSGERR